MRRSPSFTLVAVATLALGIGANTAIFSVVNALLLRPLPYPGAERLVMVWQDMRARGGPATEWTGPANHFDWKSQTDVFDGVATLRGWNATLAGGALPESVLGEQTTWEYFDVLGIAPELGRGFRPSDDVPNAPRVTVLSHALWQQRFGGDPTLIGRVLTINGESYEVIGVMPASFTAGLVTDAGLWRPMRLDPVNPPRNAAVFHTIARLRRGITLAQARTALAAFAQRLEQAYPESQAGTGINPVPLQEQKVGDVKPALFMLLGAVGFVLLIACVNIANLLLSRASGRLREMAVRRALGADSARIARQLLTESVLLGAAGGAAGVLCAVWGVSALKALAPESTPRVEEIAIDATVLSFAAMLSIGTGLLFGLVPAWHAVRGGLTLALKQGGRAQTAEGGAKARRVLIAGELALALMLLVGGGLLIRTFLALQRADLGFNPEHVLAGFVLPQRPAYRTDAQRLAFYDAVLARAAALPGVTEAALSSVLPLGGDSDTNFVVEGRPAPRSEADTPIVWYREVSANYFAAMSIPLRRGRLFADREAMPAAVINETMARRYWPGEDPVGRRIQMNGGPPWLTIVGIVADVQVRGARGEAKVEAYIPYWQAPEPGSNIVLKTATDPAGLSESLRRAVKDIDPAMAVAGLTTMEQIVANANGPSRFYATLVATFAAIAALLAAVGLYGVMSYAVAMRTQEIGVRVALGAGERQIFGLVVGDSLKIAVIGIVVGAAGASVLARMLRSLLFGVGSTDPLTFGVTAAILAGVAFGASYVPARRAMRIDPAEALRAE